MSKLTAMAQLIEFMQKNTPEFSGIIMKATELLETERKLIIDSWNNGIDNCGEFNTPDIATAEQYFTQTFTQK